MSILPVNVAMLGIGLLDLLSTIFWLHNGCAIEVNPVMSAVLKHGLVLFIAVKLSTLVAYIAVMEWYRRYKNPVFARVVGIITVAAYLTIYAVSFCGVNHAYFLG